MSGAWLSTLQNIFKKIYVSGSSIAGEGLCKGHIEHEKQKHFPVFIIQITSVKLTFYQDIQWLFTFAKILVLFITWDTI